MIDPKQIIKIIFRIIALPFVAVIVLIASIRNYIYTLWLWLSRGGELLMHDDTFNPETIRDQFKKLIKIIEEADKSEKS